MTTLPRLLSFALLPLLFCGPKPGHQAAEKPAKKTVLQEKLVSCGLQLVQPPAEKPAEKAVPQEKTDTVRAKYLITVADDFVVEVYHNGKAVPESKRTLLDERFGATAERFDIEVRRGDWLVFNVVNNRIRWGGAYYFAVAGCFNRDEFGFISNLDDGNWSACDTPGDVDRFISQKTYFQHRPAQKIVQPWSDGTPLMQQHAGPAWNGAALWGATRNTWVKVIVE